MTCLLACSVLKSCFEPFVNFYKQMTNPKYNAVSDVYSKMFLWDFVAFLVIVFGYTSFGPVESTGGSSCTAHLLCVRQRRPLRHAVTCSLDFILRPLAVVSFSDLVCWLVYSCGGCGVRF